MSANVYVPFLNEIVEVPFCTFDKTILFVSWTTDASEEVDSNKIAPFPVAVAVYPIVFPFVSSVPPEIVFVPWKKLLLSAIVLPSVWLNAPTYFVLSAAPKIKLPEFVILPVPETPPVN